MDRILYTAMSGAKQSMDQQAVVNHNLSNVSTTGFRAQLHAMRAVPVQGDGHLPTRVSVAATTPGSDFSQGPMMSTGRELDVALEGGAWLAVQADDGSEAYTRRGDLQVDGDGIVMLAGRPVIGEGGPIVVPLGAQLSVGSDGTLSAIGQGEDPDALVDVGRLKLVTPEVGQITKNVAGLIVPRNGQPLAADDNAQLQAGALEGINVSAVEEMVATMSLNRDFEVQMKLYKAADSMAESGNRLIRD